MTIKTEVNARATDIYGPLVPKVSFEGTLGDKGKEKEKEKEPLYVYLMNRMPGITQLDFVLANGYPNNTPSTFAWRKNLMGDVAHFMALAWKAPQPVSSDYRVKLGQAYLRDLHLLHAALPSRFQPIINTCISALDDITSLPIVLLRQDFGGTSIMVDETTSHLVGVIDWAEAEFSPFGLNLYVLEHMTGHLHLRNGWSRFKDYGTLQDVFWERFQRELGGLSGEQLRTIKLARALGILLSRGVTSRLANDPEPVPIGDDETGRYNMLSLDGFLINPETRIDDLNEKR